MPGALMTSTAIPLPKEPLQEPANQATMAESKVSAQLEDNIQR